MTWYAELLVCALCERVERELTLPEADKAGWTWFTGFLPKRQEICPRCMQYRHQDYLSMIAASRIRRPAPTVSGSEAP